MGHLDIHKDQIEKLALHDLQHPEGIDFGNNIDPLQPEHSRHHRQLDRIIIHYQHRNSLLLRIGITLILNRLLHPGRLEGYNHVKLRTCPLFRLQVDLASQLLYQSPGYGQTETAALNMLVDPLRPDLREFLKDVLLVVLIDSRSGILHRELQDSPVAS